MTLHFSNLMQKALRLTRENRVLEATKQIQAALSKKSDSAFAPLPHENEMESKPGRTSRPRRPLGEVINSLQRYKTSAPVPTVLKGKLAKAEPDVPKGAKFLSLAFSCAAGSRNYRLYLPQNRSQERRPLLIMLHGCKQDPVDFAIGTGMNALAETHDLVIAYPAQSTSANISACWNWFNPADQQRGLGEPSIVAGLTNEIIARHNIDRERVFIAGLSAGGAMAVVMGETYPDLYAAIGVHSGLPYRSANDVVTAFAAMRGEFHGHEGGRAGIRTIVFHGDSDKTVHPSNRIRIGAAHGGFEEIVEVKETGIASGGRKYTRITKKSKSGRPLVEEWIIHGAGHAWSGGDPNGSYTDPQGPRASEEMIRFFLAG